jgi:hypothetical protein
VQDVSEEDASIPHEAFIEMIECAFEEKATRPDIMAVCKRSVIVVNGKLACYLRLPGIDTHGLPPMYPVPTLSR